MIITKNQLQESKYILRDDQQQLLDKTLVTLQELERVVFCAPTGFGKSVLLSALIREYAVNNKRVLLLCHRDTLIQQLSQTLTDSGISHGYIKAGYKPDPEFLVQLGSVQTLNYRTKPEVDLLVLDECHITTWSKAVSCYFPKCEESNKHKKEDKDCQVVGFTATPWSLSKKKQLATRYQDLVLADIPKNLMDRGVLCRDRYYANYQLDLDDVGIRNGDYKQEELKQVCDHPEVIKKAVQDWLKFGEDRSTVAFCVDIEHAKNQMQAFRDAGITSELIIGDTPIDERNRIFRRLDLGITKVICSVGVLTEGWDYKKLGCAILLRPTKSKNLFFQMVGRALRGHPDKEDAIIIDLAGNTNRFGLVKYLKATDYSLEYKKLTEGEAPVRTCPECGNIQYTGYKECQVCDYVFPKKERQPELSQLEDYDNHALQYRKLIKLAFNRKYNPGYPYMKFREQFEYSPKPAWARHCIFNDPENVKRDDLIKFASWIKKYISKKSNAYGLFSMHFKNEFGNIKPSLIRKYWNIAGNF